MNAAGRTAQRSPPRVFFFWEVGNFPPRAFIFFALIFLFRQGS